MMGCATLHPSYKTLAINALSNANWNYASS
jgi:hypothetical protein